MAVSDDELAALPREELVGRARALETMLDIGRAVGTARGIQELADRFADAVAAYTRFPAVIVLRYSAAREDFEILAQRGFDESKFPPRRALPLKGSLTGLAVERREILTTEDIAEDDRIDPPTRAALTANQYASGACVPLLHGGEVLGSLNLVYPRGAALQPGERKLLGTLGATLSLAMAEELSVGRERELEAHANRAQQLESLGTLAGGIAHDFNNLLTGIVGNLEMVRLVLERSGSSEATPLLDEALGAAARSTALVKQLLTFSRAGVPDRRPTDALGQLVRDVASFVSRGFNIRCDIQIEEPLGVVEVDAGQIGQVIQNLVLNALQASPAGGAVVVRAFRAAGAAEAARVIIEVADRGEGIPPEHIGRIFEPFFSRRAGGTGLGLAVSHSIVRRHGGTLRVQSDVGIGTTFTVDLPASDRLEAEATTQPASPRRFQGSALVLDDEAMVRRVASLLLRELGLEATAVADGDSAVAAAERAVNEGRPFSVALLDLTIVGGKGGLEVAADLRRVSPATRLVLSTGYAREGAGDEWDASLPKPYKTRELAAALEKALQGRQ